MDGRSCNIHDDMTEKHITIRMGCALGGDSVSNGDEKRVRTINDDLVLMFQWNTKHNDFPNVFCINFDFAELMAWQIGFHAFRVVKPLVMLTNIGQKYFFEYPPMTHTKQRRSVYLT